MLFSSPFINWHEKHQWDTKTLSNQAATLFHTCQCPSFSHGDCTHSWRCFSPKRTCSGARIFSVPVQRISDILLCTLVECEESPRASNQIPHRPSSPSCQEWARRFPCHCEGVWSNLQVILVTIKALQIYSMRRGRSYHGHHAQVSHGKAATGDRGQCRAVQGSWHQEVQGHPQSEHPAAVNRFPAPGRPLPHQVPLVAVEPNELTSSLEVRNINQMQVDRNVQFRQGRHGKILLSEICMNFVD